MQNSQIINQIQFSDADLECIFQEMHALFKYELEDMEKKTHLKYQVAELPCQADRAEQYSRHNCLRITGILEARDEDTDNIIVTMAKDLGAKLSVDEIDRSHRVGPPEHSESAWTHDGNILVRDLKRVIHRVESAQQIRKLRSNANRAYASVTNGSK
ncbi:hypothetical protein DPMN_006678 [Dreissena polymorpha]|uniref:Uncharacterized protein n=1 Tax=Dreissena polymorpha TaxID=45954 RepID=A0A9D4RXP6_DREPO|nr:hypothetical protein DPMN_006678 [Dreissena polymorpha]